jgi:crossover junction endodeoxyribonuclease RusA
MIIILDHYPPSANAIWRAVPGRGVIKSALYRTWLIDQTLKLHLQTGDRVEGHYHIHFKIQRKDKRRRDLDNLLKPLHDLIVAAGLVDDDSLCDRIVAEWDGVGQNITIEITGVNNE